MTPGDAVSAPPAEGRVPYLGNRGNSVSRTTDGAWSEKILRYLRGLAQRLEREHNDEAYRPVGSKRPSQHRLCCGRRCHGTTVEVRVSQQGRASYGGVMSCASVWECPVCASKVARDRRGWVQRVCEGHRATGGGVYLATLTIPHGSGDALRDLREHLLGAWRRVWQGKKRRGICRDTGYVGSVRVVEVTHGRNGWHPHLHVLIFAGRGHADTWRDWLHRQWCRAVVAMGGGLPGERAVDVRLATEASSYLTKMGVVSEVTGGHRKAARRGNRSPWQILRAARDKRDRRSRALWREYCEAMRGTPWLAWGRRSRSAPDLRELYAGATRDEQGTLSTPTDRELAGQSDGLVVARMPALVWRELYQRDWRRRENLLAAVERGDYDRVRELLRMSGAWYWCEPPPRPPPTLHQLSSGHFWVDH